MATKEKAEDVRNSALEGDTVELKVATKELTDLAKKALVGQVIAGKPLNKKTIKAMQEFGSPEEAWCCVGGFNHILRRKEKVGTIINTKLIALKSL